MSIPPGSLQHSYDFSNATCYSGSGSTVYDLAGSLNLPISGATFASDGSASYFSFDGNADYIGKSGVTGLGNTFTANMWYQPTTVDANVRALWQVGVNSASGTNPGFVLNYPSTGDLIYGFSFGVGTTTVPGILSANTWQMATITADGTTAKVYIDGVLEGSVAQGIGTWATGGFAIGAGVDASGNISAGSDGFLGKFATLDIYNVALGSTQITNIYNDQAPRFDSLVASYDFSDPACYSGSGNTVYDLAGSLDLPIVNASFVSNGSASYFNFNGTNALIGKNGVTGLGNTFSISMWSKYPSSATTQMFPFSAGTYVGSQGAGPQFALNEPSTNFGTIHFNDGIGSTSFTSTPDVWHNYTFTADGTNVKAYLDGALAASVAQGLGSWDSGGLYLGVPISTGGNYYPGFFYNGQIGIFNVYNSALGSTQITNIYNDQAPRFDSLVASYDLNSLTSYPGTGNTLYDLSGNNFDITLSNTSYYDSTTYDYNSLVFTKAATSIGTYSGSLGLGTTNPNFTFFMWVKPVDVTNGVNYSWFISYGKEDGTLGGAPMILPYYAGSQNLSTGFGSGKALIQTGTGLTLNDWVSLATTCDGTTYKIYKNGAQIGSTTLSGAQIVAPEVLALNYLTGNPGLGTLDYELNLLQVYDKALSLGEISTLHNDTVDRFTVPTTPVLIGSYDFSDPACYPGSGSTVFDLTTENNDLTITATGFGGVGQSQYATFNGDTTYLYRSQFSASGSTFSSDEFTLSLWHNYPNSQSNQATMIMGGNGAAGQGIQLQVNGSDANKITAAFGIEITEGGQLVGIANTSNTWHMSTVTGDGSLLKLYQDGAFIGSTTQIGSWDGRGFIIGRGLGASYQPSPLGPGLRYSGFIGIAEVYSGALGSTAISDLYDIQQPRFYPPTMAVSYDFSDPACYNGTGNTVIDLSTYGNDLTLYNSPTFTGTGQSQTLVFDGVNQYGKINAPINSLSQQFTYNIWAKFPTIPNPSVANVLLAYGSLSPSNSFTALLSNFTNSNLTFITAGAAVNINSGISANQTDFYNLVVTNDGAVSNNIKFYVNGTLVGTGTYAQSFEPSAMFNLASNIDEQFFTNAEVGLVEIYNVGLGSTSVTELYNNQKTRFGVEPEPPYVGIVGGRQFNQGFNG